MNATKASFDTNVLLPMYGGDSASALAPGISSGSTLHPAVCC
jgi:hypothetical protein